MVPSKFSVKETIDRLASAAVSKNLVVFARIDHGAGAAEAGLPLRPTELLIFGNAKAGTPLMQAKQTMGIDLPLKALAWEDAAGKVWVTINDPAWLAQRHQMPGESDATVHAMQTGLKGLIAIASGG
jgi:uncharacterized protein (DUF302 family)